MNEWTDAKATHGEGVLTMEQQRDNWIETARNYAENADYWRSRFEATFMQRLRRIVRRIRR